MPEWTISTSYYGLVDWCRSKTTLLCGVKSAEYFKGTTPHSTTLHHSITNEDFAHKNQQVEQNNSFIKIYPIRLIF